MRVFFDVDLTWLGQDDTVRPGTRELWLELIEAGHEVHVWSGAGDRTAELLRHGLHDLVSGVYLKPLSNMAAGHEAWGIPVRPDFVVDDHPGPPTFMGGRIVTPYIDRRDVGHPDEWDLVRAEIAAMAAKHQVGADQAGSSLA